MKAHLIANDVLKLPVPIGTPVYVQQEEMTAILVEYSLVDVEKEVYLTLEEAEAKGLEVVQCIRR